MTVSELIEQLKLMPQDMIVVYDYDSRYSTGRIEEVSIHNEYYNADCDKVVVLY